MAETAGGIQRHGRCPDPCYANARRAAEASSNCNKTVVASAAKNRPARARLGRSARSGAERRRIGGIEEGGQRRDPAVPHLDQVKDIGIAHLPVRGAERTPPVYHGPGWVDDAAVLGEGEQLELREGRLERHVLLGPAAGAAPAIHPEAAILGEAGCGRLVILALARRIGLIEDAFDCGAGIHPALLPVRTLRRFPTTPR